MQENSTKIKFKRKRRSKNPIDTLTLAQKIAFAPITFQIVASMLDFGIFKALSEKNMTKAQLMQKCGISRYTIDTLFDAALCIGLVERNSNGEFSNTKLADAFLYDEMTRVNFNFVRDICYLGASELSESFRKSAPVGLNKYYFNSPVIYSELTKMNERMKKSWYEFDHHYSDECFEQVLKIIFSNKPKIELICDIGGNTGKFERACLDFNHDCKVVMVDLEENIRETSKNFNTNRCSFLSADILSDSPLEFQKTPDVFFMSQFLDCFSREQILFILNKIANASGRNTKIYILEPFIDNQNFKGAAYALSHISLYFTCMANGCSKMYNECDMLEIIANSKLKVTNIYHGVGRYDYTLLECVKNEVV